MKRHYYITDDLDDLEAVAKELEDNGVTTPQMHVLSDDDGDVENHNLRNVEGVLKKDVVNSMIKGALIGLIASIAVLVAAYFSGFTNTHAGWVPFIFLSAVILGFSTWEGGFLGIQAPHNQLKRFENALKKGKHVFFVDVDPEQESILTQVLEGHSHLKPAGIGAATPRWVVRGQDKFKSVVDTLP